MSFNLFNTPDYPVSTDFGLLVLRVASGGMMLSHGTGKFESLFSSGPVQFADPIGIGPGASLALAVFAEVLCALLLIIGFATRLASVPLLITMAVAVFVVHLEHEFAKQELGLLYGAIFLLLALAGAGKYSVDYLIGRRNNKNTAS